MISAALSLDRLPIGPGTEILPCRNRRKLCHQRDTGSRGRTNQAGPAPDDEDGLNYLCAGYKAFISHIDKPMQTMAELLKQGRYADEIMKM
ncbi:MAG: hypothetical protein KGJ81_16565 [Alphaproteobacteria bacterium]|nr:hypothetical protein [Alphaproteobacteria bacterium]